MYWFCQAALYRLFKPKQNKVQHEVHQYAYIVNVNVKGQMHTAAKSVNGYLKLQGVNMTPHLQEFHKQNLNITLFLPKSANAKLMFELSGWLRLC